ncbi:MAG: hypothetical protein K1X63_06680 [Chitinophagales bacterium]|nr:hypothetical protein [Bacteroidota bacterium]MBX7140751.1 hypothetical protein [Chitinophagales bacterium]
MKNFNQDIRFKYQERAHRFTVRFLSLVIAGIVLGAILLRLMGVSTDNVGW